MDIWKKLIKRIREYTRKTALNKRLLSRILADANYLQFCLKGRINGNNIIKTIDTFVPAPRRNDQVYFHKLIREMLYARYYYGIINKEYFLYRFEELSDSERKKYIGAFELNQYYKRMDKSGHPEIINNKEKTFEVYRDFFHRDVLLIQEVSDKESFLAFLRKHNPCLLKPLQLSGGKGIELVEYSSDETAEELLTTQLNKGSFLMEEIIQQDPDMAKFHPQSVNTIRYTTFFHRGKLTRIQAVFRVGIGSSFVDNASSGGIYALVDTETGTILTPARSWNDCNKRYITHPDTGVLFPGTVIPKWDELNQILEKVVRVLPEQKQVGWDFALSNKGWVIVEANTGPSLQTFDPDHGLREVIAETLGQVIPVRKR